MDCIPQRFKNNRHGSKKDLDLDLENVYDHDRYKVLA